MANRDSRFVAVGFLTSFCLTAMGVMFSEGLRAQGTHRPAQPQRAASPADSAKHIAGAYADPEDPSNVYLALKPDGTFLEGTPDGILPGKYKAEGDKVTFQIEGGSPFQLGIQRDGLRQLDYPRVYVKMEFLPEAIADKRKQVPGKASGYAGTGSRLETNERIAVGCLWTIFTAEQIFSTRGRFFAASLKQLGPPPTGAPPGGDYAGLIDPSLASGIRSGYRFVYVAGPQTALGIETYSVRADPVTPGVTGREHYYMDNGGVRHNPDRQAGPNDEHLR